MADQPIIAFASPARFRHWLSKNHADHPGIWLKIAKKGSGISSVTYAEALDEALCFGWIDGQKNPFDEKEWLQKFTKRGPKSVWSKINTGHIERLTREGRMQPAGMAAVDAAKADGRWDTAYHSSKTATIPSDFQAALSKHKKAMTAFEAQTRTIRFAMIFRVTTAKKPETRAKRIADFVDRLKRGEKIR